MEWIDAFCRDSSGTASTGTCRFVMMLMMNNDRTDRCKDSNDVQASTKNAWAKKEIDVVVDETGTCAFDTFTFICTLLASVLGDFLSLSKRYSLVTSNQMSKLPLLSLFNP